MKIDLSGKTALVTGSTGGIGLAIAKGLAAAGTTVIVNGRGSDSTKRATVEVAACSAGGKVCGVSADVSTAQGCERLAKSVPTIDILVNNAGVFELKPFFETTDEDWQRFFEVNVMSGVRLSRWLMPSMMQRNWGRIVFISSESAIHIPKEMIHYGFTKTGNLAVSRGLAELTAGTNVTVNAVLPGPTLSESVSKRMNQRAAATGTSLSDVELEFFATRRPTSLLGRFASVEEIANMVVYVCSREASATNGAALRVDGGVVRTIT